MERKVKNRMWVKNRTLATLAMVAISVSAASAADLPSVVKDGKIAYVLTHRLWAVMSNPQKTECPYGLNTGPREQFHHLFPDDGTKRTVVETYLQREADQWLPTRNSSDPFPFLEAQGPIVHGMNLDGKVKPTDFTNEQGEKGIDNQLYRATACIFNFRGPSINPIWWYENEYVRRLVTDRLMIEISNVHSLENDDNVIVKSYRGMDDLLVDAVGDATGQVITPGGTQRIDAHWGAFALSKWKGKIVNGVLITEPADVLFPSAGIEDGNPVIPIRGARFKLKLTPQRAEGVMAGYADILGFEHYINTNWPTDYHSNGEMPTISMFHDIERLADGYPDPKTGKMTAISSAMDLRFTRINIVSQDPQLLPHRVAFIDGRQQDVPGRRHEPQFSRPQFSGSGAYQPPVADLEVSLKEPMPPGFGVQSTDVDGPVFIDARGMTVYVWPFSGEKMQLGGDGDTQHHPSMCSDTKITVTSGQAEIYPAGLILPDLNIRLTCAQAWPPVVAGPDAKPVGKWTITDRADGSKQWAYDGMPLYTSSLDTKRGQVNGGPGRDLGYPSTAAMRMPVGPPADHPPVFQVKSIPTGRVLMNADGYVIYASDDDRPNVSNCKQECLNEWTPVYAGQTAQPRGEWGVVEMSPGVRQWTFRSMPLYTYALDRKRNILGNYGLSLIGNDVPRWHPVYAQKWPEPPKGFTIQDTRLGQVLADENGKTLYIYYCNEDTLDQLSCDHPSQSQSYRLMICGRGDPAACDKLFPYVLAPKNAVVDSLIWGTAWIDPRTGRFAKPNQPGALHVWTYRDRPLFTHSRDKKPGDIEGDAWGEGNGYRNGFKAFWLRDDFAGSAS
jgi:predicted lipoprotein with Yx(FWY)xxD motif